MPIALPLHSTEHATPIRKLFTTTVVSLNDAPTVLSSLMQIKSKSGRQVTSRGQLRTLTRSLWWQTLLACKGTESLRNEMRMR